MGDTTHLSKPAAESSPLSSPRTFQVSLACRSVVKTRTSRQKAVRSASGRTDHRDSTGRFVIIPLNLTYSARATASTNPPTPAPDGSSASKRARMDRQGKPDHDVFGSKVKTLKGEARCRTLELWLKQKTRICFRFLIIHNIFMDFSFRRSLFRSRMRAGPASSSS